MAVFLTILRWTLSIALGIIFLLSGIGKLLALSDFEWTFRDLGIANATGAFLIARGLIGLELVTGLFLLFQFRLRRLTLPLVFGFLLVFSGYLAWVLYDMGNQNDCGCFGALAEMTPIAALVKNGIMLAAAIGLFFLAKKQFHSRVGILLAALSVASFIIPLFIRSTFNLSPLYTTGKTDHPKVDLRKGRHIVAFMSVTCSHCREAATRMKQMHDSDATLPFYIVLMGKKEFEAEFFQSTQAGDIPHVFFSNTPAFIEMAGPYVPAIYWLNDSHLDYKANYRKMSVATVRDWAARK